MCFVGSSYNPSNLAHGRMYHSTVATFSNKLRLKVHGYKQYDKNM